MLNRSSLTKQKSITKNTSGIVIEDSAILVEIITFRIPGVSLKANFC